MVDNAFDTDAWLRRIGLERPLLPTLGTLRAVVEAHATTVPFENIDVLLGRVPLLDLASLQRKMVTGGRGGYCFELNTLLCAGLTGLGFQVTGLGSFAGWISTRSARRRIWCCALICLRVRLWLMSASAPRRRRRRWPGGRRRCRPRRMSPLGFGLSPTNSWCRRNAGKTGKTSIAFRRDRRCRPTMRSQTGSARRTPPARSPAISSRCGQDLEVFAPLCATDA